LYASLVTGIVNGFNVDHIPIATFGSWPIKILANQYLGSLTPCATYKPTNYETYLNLSLVFQGLPPIKEQDNDKTGFPYVVTPPPEDDKLLTNQAVISNHWEPEYKASIMDIVTAQIQSYPGEDLWE
jgi:hypothetical protein